MKKVISIIILNIFSIVVFGFLLYALYVEPIYKIKSIDKWYEYGYAIIIFTIVYGLIGLAFLKLMQLIDWAKSNIDK